jgi:hypothetical protein
VIAGFDDIEFRVRGGDLDHVHRRVELQPELVVRQSTIAESRFWA